MADAPADTLRVTCDCGARLKVPAKAAGRRVKCPKCTAILKVPAKEPPPPEPEPLSGGSDTGALLEQLAAEARVAPAASGPSPAIGTPTHCPGCGAALASGAKLCVSCGYSLTSGHTVKAAKAPAAPSGLKLAAAGTGRLALGCVLSGVAAGIGAVVWVVVVIVTGYEVGLIAWGVGLAAGLGMLWGNGGPSGHGGVIAAVISALGILGAKLIMFAMVAGVSLLIDEAPREFLTMTRTEEALERQEVDTEETSEERWDAAYEEESQRVAEMSDEEVQAELDRMRQDLLGDEEITFLSMFGWLDILFFALALGSAFKLAGGGFS